MQKTKKILSFLLHPSSSILYPLSFLLCPLCVMGQELTLDSCLALAQRNNAEILSAQLEVKKAQEVRNQARTKYFPQISGLAGGYHALQPLLDLNPNELANAQARDLLNSLYTAYGETLGLNDAFAMFRNGAVAGVMAVQPVYMGGKIVAGNQLAKVGVEAAQYQAQIKERDVLLQVEESYWLVVNLQAKQQLIDATKALLDTIEVNVQQAVEAGLAIDNDLLRVQLKRNELEAMQIQLTDGLDLASRALAQSIGLDSLILHPSSFILSSVSSINSPSGEQEASLPETALLDAGVKAAQLRRRMDLADALPHVILGGSYNYGNIMHVEGVDLRNDGWKHNGLLFASVQIPLTGWWETAHKLKEGRYAIEQAQLQQRDLGEKLVLRHQQAVNAVHKTGALLTQMESSAELARRNYELAQESYQAGLCSITELMEAQTLYQKAQTALIDTQIQHCIALHRSQVL
ncbi:MAG: TolC family protein [Paludibacteraceae bacterium]|nr:TolC family protein [Paludibacteraceae bacterium]